MKLTVIKESFLKALQKVTNIIGNRSTIPVISNVLLETDGNRLILTTTDLEIYVTTSIEVDVSVPGKTTIPAKKLLLLVSKFRDEKIYLDCNEKYHTNIDCGNSKFTLLGLSPDDFPLPVEFAPIRKIKFPEADFSRILDQISYAVSLDDSRKVLHGILFSVIENTFTAVATDGKRLALVEKILDEIDGVEGDSIIPFKSAVEVKRLLEKSGEVIISIGDKQASFQVAETTLTTKLIEGNYPNYRQVIPTSFSKEVELVTKDFISSLELVSIALVNSTSIIKLNFNQNKLLFEAESVNIGNGNDYMDIDYTDSEVEISFNPGFLAEPFKHSDADKVILKMSDGFNPVAIEGGDGFLYVIMPMRNK